MSLFQAYCIDTNDDGNFVLTFANSYVADEWWRAISETPAVASFFSRTTPQLYTHEANSFNLSAFFTDPRTQSIASKFQGRFFVLDDKNGRGLPIVQSLNVTNIISKGCYFVRTIASPHLYWDCNVNTPDKYLTLSETPRTRFVITGIKVPDGTVLIDQDYVTLEIFDTSLRVDVSYDNVRHKYTGFVRNTPRELRLNEVRGNFVVSRVGEPLQYSGRIKYPAPTTWELVD